MPDATYQPKIYRDTGGDREVVASGGTLLIESGGAFDASGASAGAVTLPAGEVSQAEIAAASLDATIAKVLAESAVIGGLSVTIMVPIVAGALGDTNVVMTHKVRVLGAHVILRGAGVATTTLQVKNGANAITDAMAASGSDQAIVRAASIDDAYYDIAAAGTLRVTSATGASQPNALVVITAVRVT